VMKVRVGHGVPFTLYRSFFERLLHAIHCAQCRRTQLYRIRVLKFGKFSSNLKSSRLEICLQLLIDSFYTYT
jgi:hypothetical protein